MFAGRILNGPDDPGEFNRCENPLAMLEGVCSAFRKNLWYTPLDRKLLTCNVYVLHLVSGRLISRAGADPL